MGAPLDLTWTRLRRFQSCFSILFLTAAVCTGCSHGGPGSHARTMPATGVTAEWPSHARPAAAGPLLGVYDCCVDALADGLLAVTEGGAVPPTGMAVWSEPTLTPGQARLLVTAAGDICLPELQFLPPDTARVLGGCRGILRFGALQELDPAAAAAFGGQRDEVSFGSLQQFSPEAAAGLARMCGTLKLDALRQLSPGTAAALADHHGSLCLNGIEELSDQAAEVLARHHGDLCLNGLRTLSVGSAAALANHRHGLHLNGLGSISVPAAEWLAEHRGWAVSLNGLQSRVTHPEAFAVLRRNRRVGLSVIPPALPAGD